MADVRNVNASAKCIRCHCQPEPPVLKVVHTLRLLVRVQLAMEKHCRSFSDSPIDLAGKVLCFASCAHICNHVLVWAQPGVCISDMLNRCIIHTQPITFPSAHCHAVLDVRAHCGCSHHHHPG